MNPVDNGGMVESGSECYSFHLDNVLRSSTDRVAIKLKSSLDFRKLSPRCVALSSLPVASKLLITFLTIVA